MARALSTNAHTHTHCARRVSWRVCMCDRWWCHGVVWPPLRPSPAPMHAPGTHWAPTSRLGRVWGTTRPRSCTTAHHTTPHHTRLDPCTHIFCVCVRAHLDTNVHHTTPHFTTLCITYTCPLYPPLHCTTPHCTRPLFVLFTTTHHNLTWNEIEVL